MNALELQAEVALGEDSTRQFKVDVRNAESLAAEMAAFANANGGTIFIGVADDGTIPGLTAEDVGRLNQLISNVASQLVRSPLTVQTENIRIDNGLLVIKLTVAAGLDKPYFDKNKPLIERDPVLFYRIGFTLSFIVNLLLIFLFLR